MQVADLLAGVGLLSFSDKKNSSSDCNKSNTSCINLSSSYMDSLRLSPEPKNRKTRKSYTFIRTFDTLNEIDAYVNKEWLQS